jgi:hypothetical protein
VSLDDRLRAGLAEAARDAAAPDTAGALRRVVRRHRRRTLVRQAGQGALALAVVAAAFVVPRAIGGRDAVAPATRPATSVAPSPVPPWTRAPLPAAAVPGPVSRAWRAAPGRAACPLLLPADLGAGAGAGPSPGTPLFDGWAVRWDLPGQPKGERGLFGIDGEPHLAATSPEPWPLRRSWPDGGVAAYGRAPADGTWTAALTVPGRDCDYTVWTRIDRAHLEHLLDHLRFTGAGTP